MSNKPNRPKPRATPSRGPRQQTAQPKRRNLLWLWIGIAVVVVVAGIVAIVTSGGDKELTVGTVPDSGLSTVPSGTAGVSKGEVWPVTVEGTALAPFPGQGEPDPAVGTQAPSLSGYSFDGTPVTVDPSKGPVMLVFLAHWCPHCNREAPALLAWKASGQVPANLQVIGIATAADPSRPNYPPSAWFENLHWDWPVMADSQNFDAANAMGLTGFPYVVMLDTNGKVLDRWSGELGQEKIAQRVAAALD